MKQRWILMLPLMLLLQGCLTVEDFGGYWGAAKPDVALQGEWKNELPNGRPVVFAFRDKDTYLMKVGDDSEPQLVRTLNLEGNMFLMTKKSDEDKGGTLIPYVIQEGWLVLFMPDKDKKGEFAKHYPNGPFRVSRTSISLENLEYKNMEALKKISTESQWWVPSQRYTRP